GLVLLELRPWSRLRDRGSSARYTRSCSGGGLAVPAAHSMRLAAPTRCSFAARTRAASTRRLQENLRHSQSLRPRYQFELRLAKSLRAFPDRDRQTESISFLFFS